MAKQIDNPNLDPRNERMPLSDKEIEKVIRPAGFGDFAGQEQVVNNLKIFVHAAKQRGESLDHVLLHGPPGLGKQPFLTLLPMKWVSM